MCRLSISKLWIAAAFFLGWYFLAFIFSLGPACPAMLGHWQAVVQLSAGLLIGATAYLKVGSGDVQRVEHDISRIRGYIAQKRLFLERFGEPHHEPDDANAIEMVYPPEIDEAINILMEISVDLHRISQNVSQQKREKAAADRRDSMFIGLLTVLSFLVLIQTAMRNGDNILLFQALFVSVILCIPLLAIYVGWRHSVHIIEAGAELDGILERLDEIA